MWPFSQHRNPCQYSRGVKKKYSKTGNVCTVKHLLSCSIFLNIFPYIVPFDNQKKSCGIIPIFPPHGKWGSESCSAWSYTYFLTFPGTHEPWGRRGKLTLWLYLEQSCPVRLTERVEIVCVCTVQQNGRTLTTCGYWALEIWLMWLRNWILKFHFMES